MDGRRGIFLLALPLMAGGCFSPDPESLTSDNPSSAIPAIKQAAVRNDQSAIPTLVVDLDDTDPAIRFAAISALRRMTGQTFEYQYYEDAGTRKTAVDRWREWLNQHPAPATRKSR